MKKLALCLALAFTACPQPVQENDAGPKEENPHVGNWALTGTSGTQAVSTTVELTYTTDKKYVLYLKPCALNFRESTWLSDEVSCPFTPANLAAVTVDGAALAVDAGVTVHFHSGGTLEFTDAGLNVTGVFDTGDLDAGTSFAFTGVKQ